MRYAEAFRLGDLDTERPHPLTADLSDLCQRDLAQAVQCLKAVDRLAIAQLAERMEPAKQLANAVRATWQDGGRIFLAGCGATGRLSISLETFAREGLLPAHLQNSVIAFMAGGDAALIRSIEGFEDFPDYGARQLRELGFGPNDLLIASTEGGETPWVIGVAEEAQRIAERPPWFLYCNPDAVLREKVERSRRVIENAGIEKWNLHVGPMAIAGSTRMQASSVLEYAIGLVLEQAALAQRQCFDFVDRIRGLNTLIECLDWNLLVPFIKMEAGLYQQGERVLYTTDAFGVSVLTDTTERAPTFSLSIFERYENGLSNDPPSLCYLSLLQTESVDLAWKTLLGREPRCLDWPADLPVTRNHYLRGYDISRQALEHRLRLFGKKEMIQFSITTEGGGIAWKLGHHHALMIAADTAYLEKQILLKLLLNTHSTLVMGLLGRYEGNLMTFVKPSNNKLIDRAIRYVQTLHKRMHGGELAYAAVCREIFRQRATLAPDEPVVLKTLAALQHTEDTAQCSI